MKAVERPSAELGAKGADWRLNEGKVRKGRTRIIRWRIGRIGKWRMNIFVRLFAVFVRSSLSPLFHHPFTVLPGGGVIGGGGQSQPGISFYTFYPLDAS